MSIKEILEEDAETYPGRTPGNSRLAGALSSFRPDHESPEKDTQVGLFHDYILLFEIKVSLNRVEILRFVHGARTKWHGRVAPQSLPCPLERPLSSFRVFLGLASILRGHCPCNSIHLLEPFASRRQ